MVHKLLYLVSEDWYFISHRLPMARAAKAAGYDVHVATRVGNCAQQIIAEGFNLHPVPWRRGSVNPFRFMTTVMAVRRLYRQIHPDLVHHVAFVPTVVGSLAALGLPMVKLNALTGLGFTFTSATTKARALRGFANRVLAFLLTRQKTVVLVQNPDDRAMVAALGVPEERIRIIPGSGVDMERLKPTPEPAASMFTVGFVGRLLEDKGVNTLVRAQEILAERGVPMRVLLAGTPDPSNPASIPEALLTHWRQRRNLELLGQVDDIRTVWAQAHVAVLPSRREGLPLSLLEAAACGRPLIATDVPGCREIALPGVNAILVPPDDPECLATAIETLAKNRDTRLRFGRASRQLVVDEFSSDRIGREIVALYADVLADVSSFGSPPREHPAS